MQSSPRVSVDYVVVGFFIISVLLSCCFTSCSKKEGDYLRVLVFSKTAGFRHSSIPAGQQLFFELAKQHDFQVDTTEDASVFNQKDLEQYNVIVFLSTTGDILNAEQENALRQFMQAGGGWLGIHAAADTEYEWSWYNELVGAYFDGHPSDPNVRQATIVLEDSTHLSTAHLPQRWERSDEWYNYRNMQAFQTLMRLDESTYEGGTNGDNHPIAWYREFEGGRMFYTGGGHTDESFAEPDFIQHLWGGLQYVAGPKRRLDFSQSSFTPEENRSPVEPLVQGMFEPMELEILPDGRLLWIQRRGEIMLYDPEFEAHTEIVKMDVWTEHEDGLLGMAIDPNFKENNWLYLYYSPNTKESVNQLSRFKWIGNALDLASEQKILAIPVDRNECCHSGGSIEFGPTGLLYLSVGDNTNPFDSDGFAPLDDSKEIPNFDARRTASNTMDLRGKILRIQVAQDGSYTTPADNLFPDASKGRPEIYVMGCRNPFRISIDPKSGVLYWGDVGPDAGKDSTGIGPMGHCEINYAPTAGYYGWPLFVADNKPYHQRDFKGGLVGAAFDPLAPINESRYNTGARELPPARPAMIYYPYDVSKEFPSLGDGGRNPMAGPVYYKDQYAGEHAFPDYYNAKFFFYEWMRDYIMAAKLDEEGKVVSFERFLPNLDLLHPMDMLFGPDGSLYILEYGKLWFKKNDDARLLRIRFNGGNRPPVAKMDVAQSIGALPFQLSASIGSSLDYDGDPLTATWWLDGTKIGEGETLQHTITTPGLLMLSMRLDDGQGNSVEEQKQLIVGNSLPSIKVALNGNRSFYFGDTPLDYTVTVSDQEDGQLGAGIDPAAVTVSLDYLEGEDMVQLAYGHQVATENSQFLLGKALIQKNKCAGCHAEKEANIGPAYLAVAARYQTEAKAVSYLAGKIIQGGGGVWGEQAMSAHPQLSTAEASLMAQYILSIGQDAPRLANSLPLSGQQTLNKHRKGQPGRYFLQVSYTDKGKADLPRLTARETIVLQSPLLAPHQYKEGDKVMPYHVAAKDNPLSKEDMDILVATHKGWSYYGDFDLSGISSVAATLLLAPNLTSGGTIELWAGKPDSGKLLGSASVKQGLSTFGENVLAITLAEKTSGLQPLYFRFLADVDDPSAVMGALRFLEFKQGGASTPSK